MKLIKHLILLSYISVASVSAVMITPALAQIQQGFGLKAHDVQWMISIFLAGYVIGQLVYGPIANAYGRLNALRLGMIINIVGILICLVSFVLNSYLLLLLGRLISALGAASGLVCTFILINDYFSPAKAKKMIAFALVSFTLGIGIAVTIGGVITEYLSWIFCFWALLLHAVLILISTFLFEEPLATKNATSLGNLITSYTKAIQNKYLLGYSIIVGLCASVSYCYVAIAPLTAHFDLHINPSVYGYYNLFNMLGTFISGFLASYLLKRFTIRKLISTALVMLLLCLFSLTLMHSLFPNTLWFFITSMFLYLSNGLIFPAASFVASNAIQDKASAASMMSFIYMTIATLSVIFMGLLPFYSIMAYVTTITILVVLSFILVSRLDIRFLQI